jgi:Leucine-rich repeat (LRR) protein
MCIICRKEYDISLTNLACCENIKKIPNKLMYLNLLNLDNTNIKKIPKKLIKLRYLYCDHTQIRKIPKTLINLRHLYCRNSQVKFIPDTIKDLGFLNCNKYVLVSPKTYKKEPNNKRYLTFTRCQVRYKLKLRLKNLKFAYDPKYIIGHNAKKQLARFFQN